MQSNAKTVNEYLASLPEDRRLGMNAVRGVILKNIDPVYVEEMHYGMIVYSIPHSVYPPGYHVDPSLPLMYAALASQKHHLSLYMMSVCCPCEGLPDSAESKWFQAAWRKTGKRLDMGKCCIRFKRAEDAPLEVIGEAFKRVPAKLFIERYEAMLKMGALMRKSPSKKTTAKKSPVKKSPAKKLKAVRAGGVKKGVKKSVK